MSNRRDEARTFSSTNDAATAFPTPDDAKLPRSIRQSEPRPHHSILDADGQQVGPRRVRPWSPDSQR